MNGKVKKFFGPGRIVYQATAPGRLDVMGGIADYSGSLVLQMPIQHTTTVCLSLREDRLMRVHSETVRGTEEPPDVCVSLEEFAAEGKKIGYRSARNKLSRIEGGGWAAYAIGCFLVLMREKGASIPGADVWIESKVPIGKGVSSSAALEVAVMAALAAAVDIKLERTELPVLAQKVENRIVGAPCGLMDQLATYLGEEDRLLPILCRPDRVEAAIDIPDTLSFVGIDSGVRHAVSGASYGDVRIAAFMGYTIIARSEGAKTKDLKAAGKSGDWSRLPYHGYLTEIPPSLFESRYRNLLPDKISGENFMKKYGLSIDTVTNPSPKKRYAVSNCTAHPVYENQRVNSFYLLLGALNRLELNTQERRRYGTALGEYMYQSHASYSRCGLGSAATDALVDAVRAAGPDRGVYGAKITGGGSGGTVCVLCAGKKGVATAKTIARKHAEENRIKVCTFIGSSNGVRKTGVKRIQL